jgi:SAM-dependent methyltransferase
MINGDMNLKLYEMTRLGLEPFLPPLYRHVRLRLSEQVKRYGFAPKILDVGGRKSPYTIGIPAQISVIDLPRDSEIQQKLNLGINSTVIDQTINRRSNIKEMIFGDMTRSELPDEAFDLVVSVEVLEHVEEDDLFVKQVSRVLRPGGVFIMTTPNGDWVKNTNPDHKRHYKRIQLDTLLNKYFEKVSVEYAIVGGKFRKSGLKPWSLNHPITTASSIFGNVVNTIQSASEQNKGKSEGTHHLIAVATKAK